MSNDADLAADASRGPWNESAKALVVRSMQRYGDLVGLIRACNQAEVPITVLKGPAIAQSLYPEPGLRPFDDLDVLVAEGDMVRFVHVLDQLGFREKKDSAESRRIHPKHGLWQREFVHPDTSRRIELHCDHLQLGLEPVGMEEIWGRTIELKFGDAVARALGPSDLLVHLCVHLHRHGFERLIWYKDIDLLVRSETVDWSHVEREAGRQGCAVSIAYSLSLLNKMLGTRMPGEAGRLLRQSRLSRTMMQLAWPPRRILALEPSREWRWRRAVQFAPETGLIRGGLPSLLFTGRRRDKLLVLVRAAGRL